MSTSGKAPKKTAEVLELLAQCASEKRTITYGEIAAHCGLANQAVRFPLGYIRDEVCVAHERPWLSVLAVNKKSGLPTGGWLPDGFELSDDEVEVWWREMVLRVYAYDWAGVSAMPESATLQQQTAHPERRSDRGLDPGASAVPRAGSKSIAPIRTRLAQWYRRLRGR